MPNLNPYVSASVAKASAAIQQLRLQWFLVDNLMGGTTAMRLAAKTYLPQEPKETDVDYQNRLNRSTLDNYYKEAVKKAVAKVFSKDITLEEAPSEIKILVEDIDSQSRNLTQFSKEVFADAVNHGVSYILVDLPKLPMDTPYESRAEELAAGTRPYWLMITSSMVLEARSENFNGAERLSCFKYQEVISEMDYDGAGERLITQIREYRQLPLDNGTAGPVEYFIYRQDPNNPKQFYIHEQGVITASAIPVAPVYANRSGFYVGTPPMLELAELNVQHWAQSSDLNNIIHIVTVPFLFAKGLIELDANGKASGFDISIHQAVNTPNPDADITWVEHTGTAVKTAQEHLCLLVERMQYLANQLATQASTNNTATQAAINAAESNSSLKSMALQLQDGINAALYFTAEFMGLSQTGRATVNTSYSVDTVSVDTFKQILELYALDVIDWDLVVAEAKRRNIIDPNADLLKPTQPNITPDPLQQVAAKHLDTAAANGVSTK